MRESASIGTYGRMVFTTVLVGMSAGTGGIKVVIVRGFVRQPPAFNGWGTEEEAEAGVGVRAKAGPGGKWKVGVVPGGVAGSNGAEGRGGAKTI